VFSKQAMALSRPGLDEVFFHQTVLHRSPDEFQPMENYEVAISVSTTPAASHGDRPRSHRSHRAWSSATTGVVDFTGAAPVVH
jgi:hypothetical protein